MKLAIIKTIGKESLAKTGEKLPQWLDLLLIPLNQFIQNVGSALKGNLDFENNFRCVTKSVKLTHGVQMEINPNPTSVRLRVSGVACFNAGGLIIESFGWKFLDSGNIGVTINFASGTEAECKLIIFLE